MSVRFIYGRAGIGKSTYCLNEIKRNIENNNNIKQVLLVPEQFSFVTEKNVLETVGISNMQNVEVISFTSLCTKVFTEVGGISKRLINEIGKNMIIYKSIEECKTDLTIFKTASNKQGFIDIVADTIKEFKRYNVSPELLEFNIENVENKDLKMKLNDLSIIYKTVDDRLHKTHIDSEDRLNILASKLQEFDLYDGCDIWIDSFNTFTPQQYIILEMLMKKCKSFNITLCADNSPGNKKSTNIFDTVLKLEHKILEIAKENNIAYDEPINLNLINCESRKNKEICYIEQSFFSYPYKSYNEDINNIRLFRASNHYEELEYVASNIISLVRDKQYRFKDIAIVCRNLDSYDKVIASILSQYEIPYFLDRKKNINSNPLVVVINSVLDIFNKNWSYESVFRYLKSGLSNANMKQIDLVENHVLQYGIKGAKWFDEELWKSEDSDKENYKMEKILEAREKIIAPLNKFNKKIKKTSTVRDFSTALYELLIDIKAFEKIDKWISEFESVDIAKEKEYSQIVELVLGVLDQIVDVMGDEVISLKDYAKILSIGLEKEVVGSIPLSLDEVIVGDASRIRSQNIKALFIIGTNDGVFPQVASDEGILNDSDRLNLKERGVELAKDTKSSAFEEQFLIYTTLCIPSEYLTLTYPTADIEGKTLRPSIIISKMKKLLPKLKEESENVYLTYEDELLSKIVAKGPTFNALVSAKRREIEGKKVEEIWKDVYNWYDKNDEWRSKASRIFEGLKYDNKAYKIEEEKIKKLYPEPYNFSISRIENYAKCPFSYFIKYGLKAKDRKVYDFDAPLFGTFLHNVIDKFSTEVGDSQKEWGNLDEKWIRTTIDKLVDEEINNNSILKSSSKYKSLSNRLNRIVSRSINIIDNQLSQSSFKPYKSELVFDEGGQIKPLQFKLPGGETISVIGRIDRVDLLDIGGTMYFSVIDYKSGKKSFSFTDLYYGLQIQLLVYLEALLSNGKEFFEKETFPGAILYFRIDDPIINGNVKMTDEAIKSEITKLFKMDGLVLKDIQIVQELDNTLKEETKSVIIPVSIKKDGTFSKTSKTTIDEDDFEVLRNYIRKTIVNLCSEMLHGNIEIIPTKSKDGTACDFCEFSAICQFDSSLEDNKYKVIRKKSIEDFREDKEIIDEEV